MFVYAGLVKLVPTMCKLLVKGIVTFHISLQLGWHLKITFFNFLGQIFNFSVFYGVIIGIGIGQNLGIVNY